LKNYGYLPKKSVKGEHVFITGAASGIGRKMAMQLAALGARISVTDVNLEGAEETVEMIKKAKGQAAAFQCDVTSVDDVKKAAEAARKEFGAVTMLINNAGIVTGKKILETSKKECDLTYNVNAISHMYTVQEFLPSMLKHDHGHIVSIASMAGTVGTAGLGDYSGSKFAAFGFNESLRLELEKLESSVETTCICPCFIDTGMFEGVQSKWNILLPILNEDWCTTRIVNAIRQSEPVMITPFFGTLTFLFRATLPVKVFDFALKFLGSHEAMDQFKGRN
jgi:all-trans-retinol dehydrogenase (NAD+)